MRDFETANPASARMHPVAGGEEPVELVRAALEKLVASAPFVHSRQLQRWLEFTVERALAGRADEIKEYTIAVEVLGRDGSHDTNVDPIVRTEARRLRRKLEEYYRDEGAEESLRIDYPKGSYVPRFLRRSGYAPPDPPRPRRSGILVLAGACLIFAFAFLWKSLGSGSPPRAETGASVARRIAVLPFADFSPGVRDPSLTYAITDSLTTRLAKIEDLRVASRTSVTQAVERKRDLGEIATLLKTDYIVAGSVIRSGEDCRISVQLVRARDDVQLWGEAYELPWSDILQVTRSVAESVAGALSVALGDDMMDDAANRERLKVVESYSKGQYYLLQFQLRRLRPHASEAERYLKKTLDADPDHVDAMVALAALSYDLMYPPQGDPDELLARTEAYLEQALSREPNHAGALSLLGSVAAVRGERDEALRLSRRALELAPHDARTQTQLGARLGERGFYEAALLHYDQALELDPLQAISHSARLWILGRLGRFDDARLAEEEVRRVEPKGSTVALVSGDVRLMAGDLAEARREWTHGLDDAVPGADTSYLEIALGVVDALEGDEDESRRIAEKYRDSPPRAMDHLIQLFALVGETDLAIDHIRHSPYFANYRFVLTTPTLERLRSTPAFQTLMDELYSQWQRDLVSVGPESSFTPVLPPPS